MPRSNFMESSPPFLLLFLLGYCLAMIEGELRCYCNESGCVATGYMCKSSAAKCFTAVEIRDEMTHLTHGCLENLSQEHQRSCRVSMDVISAIKADWTPGHLPLLMCCTEHMCNYRENLDVSIILTPKYNRTFHRGRVPANRDSAIYTRNHRSNRDDDRDLWFKAAVIAVPIAGGVILVLLVLLAVRMLRTDYRHHRRLIQIRQDRSLTKAQMYISEHFPSKASKQQCSLFNEKTNTTCVPLFYNQAPTNNNGGNHKSSDTYKSSYVSDISNNYCDNSQRNVSDISNNYCDNSQHSERTLIPDSVTPKAFSTSSNCQISPSCNSNCSSTCHMTCSRNGDNCSQSILHSKPCSFLIDNPTNNSNLSRDTVVKFNKHGHHSRLHATKLASSETHTGPGHPYLFVSTWETTCQNGPAVV